MIEKILKSSEPGSNRILRLPEVLARVGLSRSSVYARVKAGEFPVQVSLGGKSVGWHSDDIEKWVESCIPRHPKQ
jgi:prophage regulatory protein